MPNLQNLRIVDYQLFKATLSRYLLSQDYGAYGAQEGWFDVTPENPKSVADFSGHNGRVTIRQISGQPSTVGNLDECTFQATCWAKTEPTAGYIGQAVSNAITFWKRDCLVMPRQVVKSLIVDQFVGSTFYPANDLYYSVVQIRAWISTSLQSSQN